MSAERFVALCKERHWRASFAESVTGGMICSFIVDIPGSSAILEESYVVYSKEAKTKVLSINPAYFLSFDVVSEKIALEMAKGLSKKTMADVVIATTGVAGPTGGSKTVPVGTVCIAAGFRGRFVSKTLHLEGTRNDIRRQAAEEAIAFALATMQEG